MKEILLSTFLVAASFVYGQLPENIDFSEQKKSNFEDSKYFHSDELIEQMEDHDLSKILLTRHHDKVLGYIGRNFRRFEIRYISIIKNGLKPNEYLVYGKSRVSSNVVDFQGTLILLSAKKYKEQTFDDKTMGSVLGKYTLFENPNQKHVGTFEGYFTSDWILDKNSNELSYDDTNSGADGFSNNHFAGTWTPYNSNDFKTCNWGEYRIPYSQRYQLGFDGLDKGAGNFSPDEKFDKYGWATYKTPAEIYLNKLEVEEDTWWKN